MPVCLPKRQEVLEFLPSRKRTWVSKNTFAFQSPAQPPNLLPIMRIPSCFRGSSRDIKSQGEFEDIINETFFSLYVLTEPKTQWRKTGITRRKGKTVPSLERSVSMNS
jgi:hypothetical protein